MASTALAGTAAAGPALAANPAQGPTNDGPFEIVIDSPANGATIPQGSVMVKGRTGVPPLGASASAIYMVDVSGSTGATDGGDCNGDGTPNGDDLNGDGNARDRLDCEIAGTIALNKSLTSTSNVEVGLVPFSDAAVVADVGPASGDQAFTRPSTDGDRNGQLDIDQVARSLTVPQVGKFTQKAAGSGGTSFDAALDSMNKAFANRPGKKIGFLLTDGQSSISTAAGSPLATAKANKIVVNTYGVGQGAQSCAAGNPLRTIADQTGGTCTQVTDPSKLSTTITGTRPSGLDRVEVQVNNGTPVRAPVDAVGGFSATVPGIRGGSNTIKATIFAQSGGSVTADIRVNGQGGTPSIPQSSNPAAGIIPIIQQVIFFSEALVSKLVFGFGR